MLIHTKMNIGIIPDPVHCKIDSFLDELNTLFTLSPTQCVCLRNSNQIPAALKLQGHSWLLKMNSPAKFPAVTQESASEGMPGS